MAPEEPARVLDDLRATLDLLGAAAAAAGDADGAAPAEDRALLVGRLLTEAAILARLLDVEADAAARAAAALLRAEVESAVGEERDGTEVWDRAVRG
jgi:hypothetical protein